MLIIADHSKSKRKKYKKKFSEKKFQLKCASQNFNYAQYWNISYIEKKPSGVKTKFKCVISARSAKSAEKIFRLKSSEDHPDSKILNFKISMFHSNSLINGRKISITNWFDIRNCAFPNELNILFKYNDCK
jgi:hypothetical protein